MSSAAANDARAVRILVLGLAIAAHGIVALALLRMDVPEDAGIAGLFLFIPWLLLA